MYGALGQVQPAKELILTRSYQLSKAHSGANSAKFVETDLTNGGPTDIILPMFQNAGVINISFWMYVPAGNAGYFNIQSEPQPGNDWAFECSFKDDGTVETIRDGSVVGRRNICQRYMV